MFRKWFARSRSLVLTIVGGVVVAALVTAFAVTSTGYTAQQLNLDDSSVWVANGAAGGRSRQHHGQSAQQCRVHHGRRPQRRPGRHHGHAGRQRGQQAGARRSGHFDRHPDGAASAEPAPGLPVPAQRRHPARRHRADVDHADQAGHQFQLAVGAHPELGREGVASMDDAGLMYVYSPREARQRIQPDNSQAVAGTDNLACRSRTPSGHVGRWPVGGARRDDRQGVCGRRET